MSNEGNEVNDAEINNIDIKKVPITTNAFKWSFTASIIYIFLNIISLLMPTVMILTLYKFSMGSNILTLRVFALILDIFIWWGIYVLTSLGFGKMILIILELIHKPKEGLFKANNMDKDYKYYCLRTSVKKYIFWVWNNFAFPWISNFAFKICSMRTMTADFKSTMFDGWSDVEFIQYGNNIMIGQGAVVLSSMIIRIKGEDYFLIKKVIIGDHVVIGGNAIVAPGSIIGHSSTLGVFATTHIGQVLEPYWIYIGKPARKYQRPQWYINLQILEEAKKKAQKYIDANKKPAVQRFVDTNDRLPFDVYRYIKKEKTE